MMERADKCILVVVFKICENNTTGCSLYRVNSNGFWKRKLCTTILSFELSKMFHRKVREEFKKTPYNGFSGFSRRKILEPALINAYFFNVLLFT